MMEKFHYQLDDGYEVVLPRFENVEAGLIRRVRRLNSADQAFTILEELLPQEAWEHLDKLTTGQFNKMQQAWQQGSKLSPGESSASSTS